MRTFEDKTAIVASAFYNRYDETGEPEILQKIFDNHDMAGSISLALMNGDIELKTDNAKKWIEDTYEVLNAVFDFPDDLTAEIENNAHAVSAKPLRAP